MYDVCDAVKHHVIGAIGHFIDAALGGIITGFPWILDDAARSARRCENVKISPRAMLAREAFLHEVEWLPRVIQANQGLDPLAPPKAGETGHQVSARSVERMLLMAATTAIQLLRVDELIANPAGWQKRTGQKPVKNKAKNEED